MHVMIIFGAHNLCMCSIVVYIQSAYIVFVFLQ